MALGAGSAPEWQSCPMRCNARGSPTSLRRKSRLTVVTKGQGSSNLWLSSPVQRNVSSSVLPTASCEVVLCNTLLVSPDVRDYDRHTDRHKLRPWREYSPVTSILWVGALSYHEPLFHALASGIATVCLITLVRVRSYPWLRIFLSCSCENEYLRNKQRM